MNIFDRIKALNGIRTTNAKAALRFFLGLGLLLAGISHLTISRQEFVAQVPHWVPLDTDLVVVISGFVELALGFGLLALTRWKVVMGLLTAVFFVLIFPGNVSQYVNQLDAFGLDTDQARLIRLFFQPMLVIWALWCTAAYRVFQRGGGSEYIARD